MRWNPDIVIEAAKRAGVEYTVHKDWKKVNPYGSKAGWTSTGATPIAVMWHHTAGGSRSSSDHPSLNYCLNPGRYAGKARACNALLDRTGKFHFIGAFAQYHAGVGGPIRVNGYGIPKNTGNRLIYGVEIEAHSTTEIVPYRKGKMRGMTDLQFEAMSKFCAALCDLADWDTSAVIRHRDWTNGRFDGNPRLRTFGRKIDVGIPLKRIRKSVDSYRASNKPSETVTAPKPKPQPTTPKPPTKPSVTSPRLPNVRTRNVRRGKKNNQILLVQKALAREVGLDYSSGPGVFGPRTEAAYKRWERKLKWAKVNGIPDVKTLGELGKKYGFTVSR